MRFLKGVVKILEPIFHRSPSLHLPIVTNNQFLLDNEVQISCVTDNGFIVIGDEFRKLPFNVKQFILYHEEGHYVSNRVNDESDIHEQIQLEAIADTYAIEKIGKSNAYSAIISLIMHNKKFISDQEELYAIIMEYCMRLYLNGMRTKKIDKLVNGILRNMKKQDSDLYKKILSDILE